MECKVFRIYGVVQGVGFRWGTKVFADKIKILGHVKNNEDGSVDILSCGDYWQLSELKKWLDSGGPTGCKIKKIQVDNNVDIKDLPMEFLVL